MAVKQVVTAVRVVQDVLHNVLVVQVVQPFVVRLVQAVVVIIVHLFVQDA